jgi:aryl-alcohol dehydrogenase (NADP+)
MYYRQSDHAVVQGVSEIAGKRGVTMAQVALAWLLHQPGVTAPIIGASRMEHLEEAVKALEIRLDEEERKALAEPYEPHPVLGHE